MAPASSGYDRQTAPSSRYREVAVVRSPPMQVASPGHTRRYLSPGMRHRSPVYRPPSPPSSTFREVAYVHRGSPSRRDTPDMSPGMRHRSPVYRPPSPPSSTFREVTYVHRGSPSRRDTPDMRYSVPFSARKALGGTLQSSPEQLDSARSSERSVFIPADATPMNVGRRPPSRTTLAQQRAPDPLVNALQDQSHGPRRPLSPTLLPQQRALDPLADALQGQSDDQRRSPSPTLLPQQRASDPLVNALQGQSNGPRRPPSPTLLSQQRALDPLVNALQGRSHGSRRSPSPTLLSQQRASDPLADALQGRSHGPRRSPSPTLLPRQRALDPLAEQRAPDPLVNALQGQSNGPRRPPSPTLLSQQSASDPLVNRCVPSEPEKATLSLSPSPLHVLCSNARHAKRAGRASFDVLLKHSRRIEEWGYGVSYRILIDVMLLACVPLFLFSRIVRQRFSSSLQPLLFRSSESGHGPLSARSAGNISVGEPRLYGSAVSHDSSNGLHFSQTSSSRVLSRQAPKADDAPWYAERLPADLEHEIRMLEAKTSIDSYPRDAVQRHLNATEHYQGRPQYLGRPTEGPRRGDALATGKALKMANFDMSWEERKEHTLSKPFQKNMPPKVQKSGMYSGWPMEDDRPVVTLEEKPGTVRAFGKDGKVVASTITVWVLDMVGRKHPIVTTTDDDVIGLRYGHICIHLYLNILRMFRCVLCTVRNVLERSEKRCSWRTIHQSFILTVPAPFNNVAMTKTGRYKIMKLPWIKEIEGTWKIHGGHEIILQRKAIDKWTGTEVTLTLEVCKRSKMYTCISFLSVRASFRCDEPCIKAAC
jgi:hypothetical protein